MGSTIGARPHIRSASNWQDAGASTNAAYLMSVAVGVMNLVATMAALTVIDRLVAMDYAERAANACIGRERADLG